MLYQRVKNRSYKFDSEARSLRRTPHNIYWVSAECCLTNVDLKKKKIKSPFKRSSSEFVYNREVIIHSLAKLWCLWLLYKRFL